MGSALYAGATGMDSEQKNLEIIANNLANMSTPGFKQSKAEFADLMYQNIKSTGADAGGGDAAPTGIEIGSGSQLIGTSKVFTQGGLHRTDNEMDIAIDGDGFLEVTRPDGSTAYTRAGNLKVNSTGQVVTSTGFAVGSSFGTVPTGGKVAMASNGQVTVTVNGQTVSNFRIQLARFPNPAGLKNIGGNLLIESAASGAVELGNPEENGFGAIVQGHIERSNVNPVEEMVKTIVAQRGLEMNSKLIQSADDSLGIINHIKR